MTSSKITCKLFKLTGINSLDDVKINILNRSFAEPLMVSKRDGKLISSLPEDEKNFYYTWGDISEPNELKSQTIGENQEEKELCVEYFSATANIEYPKRRKKDSNGNILPKTQRVNYTQVVTYFMSFNNSVHLIICSSNDAHQVRVRQLVGTSFIANADKEYEIPSDLFNWLFFQFIENNGSLGEGLNLMNIGGFIGNTADEHNVFKGISDQTSELIITKAFISNGEILRTITARLRNEDIDIVFAIDYESNTQIYVSQSQKLKLLDAEDNDIFFIIYLYSHLIPKLKSLYDKASERFLSTEKNQFSEKIGLEVIKSIISKNSLSLDDVSIIFNSPSDFRDTDQKLSVNL
ncbi:hypothetical protein [Lysinibacillus sphaericus]|uniref:Uncharacterized protein n=1 Tax=Lysinibacillus sphaericus OT4b.31 TaxID=1285586 RepID=R7ZJM9_LYSSH|nr:hypothetical protein [Lysinibacillus sphaericus]EON74266.1 hypothetical protein H131_02253 [Lysinibacillus sphaericus OT4b.31]